MSIIQIRSKYQLTIPVALRIQLGWCINDIIQASIENNSLILTPYDSSDKAYKSESDNNDITLKSYQTGVEDDNK